MSVDAAEPPEGAMPDATMWATYRFRGHLVMVIQQWRDPFGRRMVRIESTEDGGAHADGLAEAAFMAEATLVTPAD